MYNEESDAFLKDNEQQLTQCKDVAVMTVIKDEAAYIHEWIHHYLYFGFKHIYIAVNRTTDETTKVLDLICAKYDNVKYFVTDWIDKDADKTGINSNMQRLSFSFLANEAFADENVSHCLSVDADEFFYPKCLKQDINQFISSLPSSDLISIHWACQDADEIEFSAPFINKNYYTTPQVKTIISKDAFENMRKFTLHVPLLKSNNGSSHIDASGDAFKKGIHREVSHAAFDVEKQRALILHRMVRSECEYLALLLRKRPNSTLRVKDNRSGIIKRTNLSTLSDDESVLTAYYDSLHHFINECALMELISTIRERIQSSAEEILDVNDEDLVKDIDVYYKVLKGTSLFSVLHERVTSMDPTFLKKHIDVNKVRDIAIQFESKHTQIALDLMRIALIVRPTGPVIMAKIADYEIKLL